ncbi:unnamed protein product [Meloidogyne enterolobii]|uniref:Uncharacterized protein n=1 Tax=Meloidogyne enterolobii TaxID=390850 RepID=A0ACB1AJ70_MELEN
MLWLRSPLTLTMLNVKLPKMLELSLDLMLYVLLMNRQQRQSLMDWTRKKVF